MGLRQRVNKGHVLTMTLVSPPEQGIQEPTDETAETQQTFACAPQDVVKSGAYEGTDGNPYQLVVDFSEFCPWAEGLVHILGYVKHSAKAHQQRERLDPGRKPKAEAGSCTADTDGCSRGENHGHDNGLVTVWSFIFKNTINPADERVRSPAWSDPFGVCEKCGDSHGKADNEREYCKAFHPDSSCMAVVVAHLFSQRGPYVLRNRQGLAVAV